MKSPMVMTARVPVVLLILLTATLFGNAANAQDFSWLNPLPTGDAMYSLSFVDSANGWLVAGGSGIVIHTSNGGISWQYQNTNARDYFLKVDFVNARRGWIAGGRFTAHAMCTTDGGSTWEDQPLSLGLGSLHYLQFLDSLHGYVGAERNYISRTTDGGGTWSNSYVHLGAIGGMYFVNKDLGYVVANGVYRTTDGGSRWDSVSQFGITELGDLYFSDSIHGWFASRFSGLYATVDAGSTWESVTSYQPFASITFSDSSHGWAYGEHVIYATTDAGATWNPQPVNVEMSQGQMLTNGLGYLCGGFGHIYRTSDGGNLWTDLSYRVTRGDLRAVHTGMAGRVWALGGDNVVGGVLLQSSDSGTSWLDQSSQVTDRLRSATFLDDDNIAWICGEKGTLYRTTDGGEHWEPRQSPTTSTLRKIVFLDIHHGWCAGDGVLLRTNDGGSSWGQTVDSLGIQYQGVAFVDTLHGWAVGGDQNTQLGVVKGTTNGGRTWEVQFQAAMDPLVAVSFADTSNGWAIGDSILRTTDGGKTWIATANPSDESLYSVEFVDRLNGWISSYGGMIYKSTDGGANWDSLCTPTSLTIEDLSIDKTGNGYVVGDMGMILKVSSGGTNGFRSQSAGTKPERIALFRNYPNPFNPATTICYDVHAKEALVSLNIYDILGQQIRALFRGKIRAGSHQITWDSKDDFGRQCPSGLYFCEAAIGGMHYTIKMVLIR